MLNSRFLERKDWEAKLRRLGCAPLRGKGPLNTAEWWRGPKSVPFTVPVDAFGRCEFWAVQKICAHLGHPLWSHLDQ